MDWSDIRAAAVCGLILWQQVQIFRLKLRTDIHRDVIRKVIEAVNGEPIERTP
jgi:hypothetical protein